MLWDAEPWAFGSIDWAGASDEELQRYSELLVQECAEFIQGLVNQRVPASEYAGRLREHFKEAK